VLDDFTQSFKNFKDGFFRVRVLAGGRSSYYDGGGYPKFSFYWTESPSRLEAVSKEILDVDSRRGWRCWRGCRLGFMGSGLCVAI